MPPRQVRPVTGEPEVTELVAADMAIVVARPRSPVSPVPALSWLSFQASPS